MFGALGWALLSGEPRLGRQTRKQVQHVTCDSAQHLAEELVQGGPARG